MKVNGPYIHSNGRLKGRRYVNIIHDDGRKTSMLYSRWIMQSHLNRELLYDETVDHIDGDPTNDDISNLQILTRSQNASKYYKDFDISPNLITLTCLHCHQDFIRDNRYEKHNRKQNKVGPFCGRSCAGKWSRAIQLGRVT